jgi:hypothetical protein
MFTVYVRSFQLNRSAIIPPKIHLWTYICLYDTLYAHEKDGTIPEGTATGEAPNAIPENWRSCRRVWACRLVDFSEQLLGISGAAVFGTQCFCVESDGFPKS